MIDNLSLALSAAETTIVELMVRQHERHYSKLFVHISPDGVVDNAVLTRGTTIDYIWPDVGWHEVFFAGNGPNPCSCASCRAGVDPEKWVGKNRVINADFCASISSKIDLCIQQVVGYKGE
jgi:hypothetical protein